MEALLELFIGEDSHPVGEVLIELDVVVIEDYALLLETGLAHDLVHLLDLLPELAGVDLRRKQHRFGGQNADILGLPSQQVGKDQDLGVVRHDDIVDGVVVGKLPDRVNVESDVYLPQPLLVLCAEILQVLEVEACGEDEASMVEK